MTRNDFAFRIDRWTDDGERIVEHVAGAEDFQIAMATYHAARKRWPKAAMTLRQDTSVIEAAGVRELAPFFRSRGPKRAAKAAGGSDERTKRWRSGRPQFAGGQERRAQAERRSMKEKPGGGGEGKPRAGGPRELRGVPQAWGGGAAFEGWSARHKRRTPSCRGRRNGVTGGMP